MSELIANLLMAVYTSLMTWFLFREARKNRSYLLANGRWRRQAKKYQDAAEKYYAESNKLNLKNTEHLEDARNLIVLVHQSIMEGDRTALDLLVKKALDIEEVRKQREPTGSKQN